jgi:hypothetical protein
MSGSVSFLVGSLRLGRVSRQCERSAELQVRQRAYGIADHDPAVIENFLEFPGGFGALVFGQIGLATVQCKKRAKRGSSSQGSPVCVRIRAATRCGRMRL